MKYLVVLVLLQFSFIYHGSLKAQWVQTQGPGHAIVGCLAVSGTNIFAGTNTGVSLSTNDGKNWTPTSLRNYEGLVNALVVSGNNIFAAPWLGGVYLSTNNG